tara:strand:+ start:899 stop:1033 length:135 start_codon:yes stop_codon:yes gene_type:complete
MILGIGRRRLSVFDEQRLFGFCCNKRILGILFLIFFSQSATLVE